MAHRNALPFQVRWATSDEFDPAHLAALFGGREFWAAIVVNQPAATVALGGTRIADSGHGVPLKGEIPDIQNPTWTWRRDGDHIALSMVGIEIGRLRESDAHLA